ncbi:hypothetical protein HK099_005962 [Clydaea vesicula]|uniref:ER membrane protein complex subunit 7 beta-sandwich domain-containing protein n=1 Tax=Clydaea vesicula TaxID=447962 RepID=A0AAD5U877_9FUNG|nr:hypothetical protein HK099_005962 [Clydaea vesicula]
MKNKVTIEGSLAKDDDLYLDASTRILLNYGERTAYLKSDGSFKFENVSLGIHTLTASSTLHYYDVIRIDVEENANSEPSVKASLSIPGATFDRRGPDLVYPLELKARHKYDYFLPRPTFNFFDLLKNPMLLMSLFSLFMMFILPKLTANMDPEDLKELQGKQINTTPSLPDVGGGLANWLSGADSSSSPSSPKKLEKKKK